MTMRPASKEAAHRRAKVYDAIFTAAERGIGASAIAEQTGLPRLQVQYALETLAAAGLIVLRGGCARQAVWVCRWCADTDVQKGAAHHAANKAWAEAWAKAAPVHRVREPADWRREPVTLTGPASVWAMAQGYACAAH
jgi:hypothetical protein